MATWELRDALHPGAERDCFSVDGMTHPGAVRDIMRRLVFFAEFGDSVCDWPTVVACVDEPEWCGHHWHIGERWQLSETDGG